MKCMMDFIEEVNYQFFKDDCGWVLYDGDDCFEVRGLWFLQFGNLIWVLVKELGFIKEEE